LWVQWWGPYQRCAKLKVLKWYFVNTRWSLLVNVSPSFIYRRFLERLGSREVMEDREWRTSWRMTKEFEPSRIGWYLRSNIIIPAHNPPKHEAWKGKVFNKLWSWFCHERLKFYFHYASNISEMLFVSEYCFFFMLVLILSLETFLLWSLM